MYRPVFYLKQRFEDWIVSLAEPTHLGPIVSAIGPETVFEVL
jgi:hypothetical protein